MPVTFDASPDRILRTGHDARMNDSRRIDPNEDPVCGMRVDPAAARERGLTHEHTGREFAFCGKGCLLDFREDPARYLDPRYVPSM